MDSAFLCFFIARLCTGFERSVPGEERLLQSTLMPPAPGAGRYCDIMPEGVTTTTAGNRATGLSVSEVMFSCRCSKWDLFLKQQTGYIVMEKCSILFCIL